MAYFCTYFRNLSRPIFRTFCRIMPPKPIVLCGPSGAGKSTLLNMLMKEFTNVFGFSVSHTTRPPREGEVDGTHYHFVTKEEMTKAIDNGEFIEHATYSGNTYGTSRKAVEAVMNSHRICILDIEIEGVKQVKKTDLDPHFIFVRPPTLKILEDRLRTRGTETEESLSRRLSISRKEMEYGEAQGNFKLIIVNDNVEKAYEELKQFLIKDIEALSQYS